MSRMLFLMLLVPQSTYASVIVTEIMYNAPGTDAKQEWIELYNNSSETVDLKGWKIFDGSNHTLAIPPKNGGVGSLSLAPNSYLIVAANAAQFLSQHTVTVSVIDSSLSLGNEGDIVKLIDGSGSVVDAVTYTKNAGARGDGNSLQWNGSAFIAMSPTPGEAMRAVVQKRVEPLTARTSAPESRTVSKKISTVKQRTESRTPSNTKSRNESELPEYSSSTTESLVASATVPSWSWVGGAATLSLLAGGAVFAARRIKREEWDIEEIT